MRNSFCLFFFLSFSFLLSLADDLLMVTPLDSPFLLEPQLFQGWVLVLTIRKKEIVQQSCPHHSFLFFYKCGQEREKLLLSSFLSFIRSGRSLISFLNARPIEWKKRNILLWQEKRIPMHGHKLLISYWILGWAPLFSLLLSAQPLTRIQSKRKKFYRAHAILGFNPFLFFSKRNKKETKRKSNYFS